MVKDARRKRVCWCVTGRKGAGQERKEGRVGRWGGAAYAAAGYVHTY